MGSDYWFSLRDLTDENLLTAEKLENRTGADIFTYDAACFIAAPGPYPSPALSEKGWTAKRCPPLTMPPYAPSCAAGFTSVASGFFLPAFGTKETLFPL